MATIQYHTAARVLKRASLLLLLGLAAVGLIIAWPRARTEPSLPELPRNALSLRDGRLYRTGETTPFAGFMIERDKDGTLNSRSAISNGLLKGVSEGWHTNGMLHVREHFRNEVSHGRREKWHEDGKKMSEVMIEDGKLNGTFRRWHGNGQLAEQIEMKQGEPDGIASSYYPSGFLKAEAKLEQGKLVDQKFWSDGEGKKDLAAATVVSH